MKSCRAWWDIQRHNLSLFIRVLVASVLMAACSSFLFSQTNRYVVTNDDNPLGNTATFYSIGTNGRLSQKSIVSTGGLGSGNGYFAGGHVAVTRTPAECIYVSNAGSIPGSVSSIVEATQTLSGTFSGSASDAGGAKGIGLAVDRKALYASFTGSGTIGVYRLGPQCTLKFVQDVSAVGLFGGDIDGMKIHGNLLVVAYGDGSVSSFDVSTGIPVSNNDLQETAGYGAYGGRPAGVDISSDGHWASFGDVNGINETGLVEIADISSGKISGTTAFSLGIGQNSNNVWFSPDNTLLYITNNYSGQVTAAYFDSATGDIGPQCISPVLRNFGSIWVFATGISTALNSGTGKALYVAEWGSPSSIGIVNVSSNGSSCTLTENVNSPVTDPQSSALTSIGVFPPRNF